MEHTIALLEAEIDSLKDAYKTTVNEEIKTEYSTRILSHKKAIRILNKFIEKPPKNDKATVIDEFDKQVDIKYLGIPNICFSVTDNDDDREEEYRRQRIERGFDDSEIWNLDLTIAKFILPRIKHYRNNCNGNQHYLKDMDKIIEALQLVNDGHNYLPYGDAYEKI